MEKPVLRISPKKYGGETSLISMRMSREMLKDIDAVANAAGRNRSEILAMCLEFALNHMEVVVEEREDT